MHLQSLELFGFKSFAEKTIFEFHEGVTAIVGPNGCGKSNVCDAVRWVLGEQSAKSLRGGEMADVIFNGTDSRKAQGFAEVSLTFTDCGSELGVAWHDVRVTRRLYRDGNSEYFLNKTGCRLKHIHNLFADTGIGRSAYSIMEQGRIDLILSSRPEDRRSVFEEAAGITKYKTQKKEALRKLEATEANLLRIGDIIKEVKRQIGSLQRQAGKARRYQALHADLQVLDTHFCYRKLQKLEAELSECGSEIERVSEAERETRSEIGAGEAELTGLRSQLDLTDERISSARAKLQQLESEIASHHSRIAFNEQRAVELTELIERSEREIETATTRLQQHEQEIESANALLAETARLLSQKKTQLDELAAAATGQREERHRVEHQLREMQIELSKEELRLAAIIEDEKELRGRRDATKRDLNLLAERIASAGAGREHLRARVQEARASHESDQQLVEQLSARVLEQEDKLRKAENALSVLEKEVTALNRAITEKESRHDVLRQLNEEGEGLAEGSQALLKSDGFEFAGALAAQLDVPPEWVKAIEAALGRNLHALILRDAERAGDVVEWLRGQQLGQAAVLLGEPPTEKLEPQSLPAEAVAWAAAIVQAPALLSGLVSRLLQNVALFENLDDALSATRSGLAGATRSGEFISSERVLFAGSGKARSDSLLERKARIDALAKELSALKQERSALEHRQKSTETDVAAASTALELAREQHQQAQFSHSSAVSRINELEREHETAERDLESLRSEHSTLERQLAAADARIDEWREQQAQLQKSMAARSSETVRLQAEREEAARREEQSASQLAEARLAHATHEQKHETLLAQRAPMLARQAELTELMSSRQSDIDNYRRRLATQAAETQEAHELIAQQSTERTRREGEIEKLLKQRSVELDAINAREAELRRARNLLSDLQEKRGAHSVRQTQLQLQREHLLEHVTHRYQTDLRQFAPDVYAHEKVLRAQLKRIQSDNTGGEPPGATTEDDLQKLIAELTRQLDNMGPVNLEAVQEYDELEERYRFLETQNLDLTNSRRELLAVIARINSTTQKLFAETFAQVRVNFREMFAELFGGGRADLQLMDENDALNCGIDIIAKPPGKQLQNISLLSGGERTMTAVALLFAIYMVRPSPFCVLDEMDAPLDESNINRFIKVLERFVEQSQFIIITHNKRTIAKADVLYGVTMEERGVSKLVGMKLAAPTGAVHEQGHENGNGSPQQHFAREESRHQPIAAAR